jgi:hypothetical protein
VWIRFSEEEERDWIERQIFIEMYDGGERSIVDGILID